MKDKLLEIISHYGWNKQLKYIHTEYFELDKAIEYIEKNNIYVENDTLRTGKWELLDILRGEDNDNN